METYEYLPIIEKTGFKNIVVQKERRIIVPDEILSVYLNTTELGEYKAGVRRKPLEKEACCAPGCCGK